MKKSAQGELTLIYKKKTTLSKVKGKKNSQ